MTPIQTQIRQRLLRTLDGVFTGIDERIDDGPTMVRPTGTTAPHHSPTPETLSRAWRLVSA